ncbi:MAG TPA: hypothetical protein VGJ30_14605 [Candidatus Angelobacter sp.]|jgi:hypothetical protein
MKTRTVPQLIYAFVLVVSLLVSVPTRAATSYSTVAIGGKMLESIFDGLTPSWFAKQNMLQKFGSVRFRQRTRFSLPDTLPEFGARYVPVQCVGCPPTEACSGHFTKIIPLPPGVGCDNPIACPSVNNFTNDPSDQTIQNVGEQNSYCGPSCCVDAETC